MLSHARFLSFEKLFWIGVLLIAIGLRWFHPDAWPDTREAEHVLSVLEGIRPTNLLTVVQRLTSLTLGHTAFVARLPALVTGTILIMTPLLLRKWLGSFQVLLLAGALALSPTLTFASRNVEGLIVPWTLAFFGALSALHKATRISMICLSLALASGSDGPAAVLTALLAARLGGARFSLRALLAPLFTLAFVMLFAVLFSNSPTLDPHAIVTQLFAQPSFSTQRLLAGFLLYEPPAWIGAIAAMGISLVKRQHLPLRAFWLTWLIAGFALAIAHPTLSSTISSTIGAFGLASYAYPALVRVVLRPSRGSLLVSIATTLVLIYSAIALFRMIDSQSISWAAAPFVSLSILIAIALFSTLAGVPMPWHSMLAAASLLLLLYTISANFRLNHFAPNNPAEPYRIETFADGTELLQRSLAQLQAQQSPNQNALTIYYDTDTPASLRWLLRDWSYAPPEEAMVWLRQGNISSPPPQQGTWVKQTLELTQHSSLRSLSCQSLEQCLALIRWIVFRTPPERSTTQWQLWIPQSLLSTPLLKAYE
ncbi:MAG: hypothetical protein QXS54_00800 [Candidatus Methanomethylicaceae archaeon]